MTSPSKAALRSDCMIGCTSANSPSKATQTLNGFMNYSQSLAGAPGRDEGLGSLTTLPDAGPPSYGYGILRKHHAFRIRRGPHRLRIRWQAIARCDDERWTGRGLLHFRNVPAKWRGGGGDQATRCLTIALRAGSACTANSPLSRTVAGTASRPHGS